jgi:hypothetical protein
MCGRITAMSDIRGRWKLDRDFPYWEALCQVLSGLTNEKEETLWKEVPFIQSELQTLQTMKR